MLISEMIKEMGTLYGMTQEAIAEVIGVVPMTVSKWSCEHDYPNTKNEENIQILYSELIEGGKQ